MKTSSLFIIWPVLLGSVFMFGCASAPDGIRKADKTTGHWDAKAQIRDFKHDKAYTLSVDFQAKDKETMRGEVSGPLGISVASIAVRPEGFQIAVHTKRVFYQGPNNSKSLEQTIGMPIDPRYLLRLLFDEPLPASEFACEKDKEDLPTICRAKNSDLVVQWLERNGELKRITIQRADSDMQILIKDYSTKVRLENDFYTLKVPENYKVISLN